MTRPAAPVRRTLSSGRYCCTARRAPSSDQVAAATFRLCGPRTTVPPRKSGSPDPAHQSGPGGIGAVRSPQRISGSIETKHQSIRSFAQSPLQRAWHRRCAAVTWAFGSLRIGSEAGDPTRASRVVRPASNVRSESRLSRAPLHAAAGRASGVNAISTCQDYFAASLRWMNA